MKMTPQSSLRNPLGVTAFPSSEPWVDEILQERLQAFKAERVTIRSGWDGYAPLARWYQNDPEAWEIPHVSGLTDHLYRLWVPYRNNKQKKEKIYVSEPYHVYAMDELVRLSATWKIEMRADLAIWYPGKTVAIWFRSK
jgi:hypothetical protein